MKKILILFLVFIIGCSSYNNSINIECNLDSDCGEGGCSGQICTTAEEAPNIITTCEYREEYSCYRLTSCGCVNNKCQWIENNEFNECINEPA